MAFVLTVYGETHRYVLEAIGPAKFSSVDQKNAEIVRAKLE